MPATVERGGFRNRRGVTSPPLVLVVTGFTQRSRKIYRKKQWDKFLEKLEQCGQRPQQACMALTFLILKKSDKRSLHAAKCKYSQTQSSELVQLHRLRAMLLRFGTRKQKQLSQVTAARTETTLQVSQSRSNGTCALATVLGKYCEGSKYSYRKQGTSLTVFHTGSLTGEFSVTSEEEKAQKFKQHLLVQAIFPLCCVCVPTAIPAIFFCGHFVAMGAAKTWQHLSLMQVFFSR